VGQYWIGADSPRAHIVTALLDVGIAVTPHQLSSVITRLRRQREDAPGLPEARPALTRNDRATDSPKSRTDDPAVPSTVTRIASVPTLTPALSAAPAAIPTSKFGAHDPRLLDEVMRSTPDMKALAKLAPKHPNQGKS